MPITRTAMIDDDGSGTTGTILNNAWKQELYGQIDALRIQASGPGSTPFTAANFTAASPMVWTVEAGDIVHNRYLLLGKTVFWSIYMVASDLSARHPRSYGWCHGGARATAGADVPHPPDHGPRGASGLCPAPARRLCGDFRKPPRPISRSTPGAVCGLYDDV